MQQNFGQSLQNPNLTQLNCLGSSRDRIEFGTWAVSAFLREVSSFFSIVLQFGVWFGRLRIEVRYSLSLQNSKFCWERILQLLIRFAVKIIGVLSLVPFRLLKNDRFSVLPILTLTIIPRSKQERYVRAQISSSTCHCTWSGGKTWIQLKTHVVINLHRSLVFYSSNRVTNERWTKISDTE